MAPDFNLIIGKTISKVTDFSDTHVEIIFTDGSSIDLYAQAGGDDIDWVDLDASFHEKTVK